MSVIIGVDIGGTFTDVVMHDEASGEIHVVKVPSTPEDFSIGLIQGLEALPVDVSEIGLIVHGTTVATNAVLERKGARCGLIMTKGFRDIIELRRRDRPQTYGLKGQFKPLISRDCRLEVEERTNYRGAVEVEPSELELTEAAKGLLDRDVEVVVISFINSYANPANEQKARRVLEKIWPNPFIVAGSEILQEVREFERTSTAVLNGYVQPLINRYLGMLFEKLRQMGYSNEIVLIQSNGGVMSKEVASRFSVNTIISGPAAGVVAARKIRRIDDTENIITCDIGGTSLDIALIVDGQPTTAYETNLGYGLPIKIPMLDIRTVGAGGGSIAWIDRAGILQIGPQSAGAVPGPACYGQGGQEPTVTDANLVLGRIGPTDAIGRDPGWRFDRARAEKAITDTVAEPLGLSLIEAAWAIVQVANHKIASSIRSLTIERGLDPRDFTLVAYGGGGPLHACAIVRELEVAQALIPHWPGVTSAVGCVTADVRHDFIKTINQSLDTLDIDELYRVFDQHVTEGENLIKLERIAVQSIEAHFYADMSYRGQIHEVRTPFPRKARDRDEVRRAFEETYTALYGQAIGTIPIQIMTLRTTVIGIRSTITVQMSTRDKGDSLETSLKERRHVFFEDGFQECRVYDRRLLPWNSRIEGPAIIEQPDATTVIEPDTKCDVDSTGNQIIQEAR
jgi:N-methylhydantoinase A